ncbi:MULTISPECIES: YpfB family protein [Bacillaceae]|uniref:YpfB family protein n=1 Tax=Bacillaceae TaxID=186817 RepID=UPI002A186755|nr:MULTISPECIES: YpfB family protein [unclassified Cytobacillus]MDX8359860.1 YpfB family protein [Cytobacillus sp. IB215316]MDX8364832.1 YpfB family protein [Cytobacillus sp. IB215665]
MFKLKRFEGIIMKLVIIQVIFLIIAQSLLAHNDVKPYISKLVDYEGVQKNNFTIVLETFDQ